jgi:Eukaryotic aspartyl protease
MQLLTPLRLLFAVVSLAWAAVRREVSFSISEVAANEGFLPSGPAEVRKTFLKYGAEPPSALVARAMVNATVEATPSQLDSSYLIPVAIGIPPVTYSMAIDTSSLDISVSAPKVGYGNVSTTVNIGGVVVTKQVVELNSGTFEDSNEVGMGYSGPSFYTNAVKQGSIAPVFTAHLNKGAPGTYGFGFVNPADYTGTITYVSVITTNGFWQFGGNGYAIGTGAFVTLAVTGIIDTGTTLLYLPQEVVTAYYKQVSGAVYNNTDGGYVFPCSATLPDLVLGISTYKATVPGDYLNYAPTVSGGSTCFGGLQPDTGLGVSIFGLTFIKSQFIVFKGTTSLTLGFAKKA